MAQITEIDPDKKYILTFTELLSQHEIEQIRKRFDDFWGDENVRFVIVCGDVLVVPADQVERVEFADE